MKKLKKSSSQTLFQMKNKESLEKLRLKSHSKQKLLVLPHMRPSIVLKAQPIETQKPNKNNQQSRHTSQHARLRISSAKQKREQSSIQRIPKDFVQRQHEEKQKIKTRGASRQHKQIKVNFHDYNKKNMNVGGKKPALKIEKIGDFKSIIPHQGFVVGKQKYKQTSKQESMIISQTGVLVKHFEGWQFNSLKDYEKRLKKLQILVSMPLFKNYYKYRAFSKWVRLYKYKRQENVKKQLTLASMFTQTNLNLCLKQQYLLNNILSKSFIVIKQNSCLEIRYQKYQAEIFSLISPKLADYKLKIFEQFLMQTLISLRKVIKQHLNIQNAIFFAKLTNDEFEDYFMRKSVENHQKSLYKFIMKYQEIKVQFLFQLIDEIRKKISYNLQKWETGLIGFQFLHVIQQYFCFESLLHNEEADGAYFVHDIKIPQININLTQNQKPNLMEEVKQVSLKFLSNLIYKASTHLKERYQSIFHGEKELQRLARTLQSKGVISERQLNIVQQVLFKINTYCFPEHYKLFKEQISARIVQINDLIYENLRKTISAYEYIGAEFIKKLEKLVQSQIQYHFQYCSYIEKVMEKLQLMPVKLKMGMFCLKLQELFVYYIEFVKKIYHKIVSQCLSVYNERVEAVRSQVIDYDIKIQISSWNIKDFIVSYQSSNEFLQFYEFKLTEKMKELESILQTIHKLQPRYYEQSYLQYYHLKEDLENVKTKSYSFIRQITYKLSYLNSQKGKRYEIICLQVDKLQNQMHFLADQQKIQFQTTFNQLNLINQKLQIQGQQIEEILIFIQIQKAFSMRESKNMQFASYDQLKNEISFLIKLMQRYREFSELMKSQLQRQYSNFRLQLLVDSILNEISKIKQSIRFLHQYQKLLLNISGFYQQENSKIKLLRLVMQLNGEDLVVLDKKNFITSSKYSALHMLEYLKQNQALIRDFIEEKQFTNKLRLKIANFQSKISKFIVLYSTQNNETNPNTEIVHFIQMLQRCEAQMQTYVRYQHLKQLKVQIYEFLNTIKRSIRFLTQYINLTDLFATYSIYLKEHGQQNGKPSFNSIFKQQSHELNYIREKWEEMNSEIAQTNLKTIIDNKFELQLQRLQVFQQMIRSQMAKISSYVSKKTEEFPLLGLLSQEMLISVLEQPILFLKYYHSSVNKVKVIQEDSCDLDSSSILMTSIYGEKIHISLQKVSSRQLQREFGNRNQYQIDLSACLQQIKGVIKNNVAYLLAIPFDTFLETIQNQSIPLQAIFVADYINNSLLLQKKHQKQQLIAIIDKQISQMLNFYKSKEVINQYCKYLIDILIVSKLQFKYKVKTLLQDELDLSFNYNKVQDEIILEVYGQSLSLQYQFVDASSFTFIEPINQKTAIKLFQSILQVKNLLLHEPSGLQSICVRLMRQLIVVTVDELPIEKAISIETKEPVLFYFRCKNLNHEWQFYQKLQQISQILNNVVYERQKRNRQQKVQSTKQLLVYKPQIFLQIHSCLYTSINKKNGDFYNELPIELKINWRIVEYFQPSLLLIMKLCLAAQGIQLQDTIQRQMLQQLMKYRNYQYAEYKIKLTHRDINLLLQEVSKYLIMFQKIEQQHISIIFRLVTTADRQEFVIKKKEKKKTVVFKHTHLAEKSRKSSNSLLKWENTKLSMEFIRFSREMDEILLLQETILVIGKASHGKSYMIKLYTEMVNSEIRTQKEKGYQNCGKMVSLEPIDINLLSLDGQWFKKQLKFFQLHAEVSEQKITLFWLQGLSKLDKFRVQQLIHKKWINCLRNIPSQLIVQLNSMSQLSPSTIYSCKQIVFREKAFGFDQIFHNMKEEINYLLAGSCFPKALDPFSIFSKIMKDFFSAVRIYSCRIFSIHFQQQILVINSLKLLKGIIKNKSPKLIDHINTLSQADRCQLLRKLFSFCFLWLSSFIVIQQLQKRYQQLFIELCKAQQIDVQNIGSAYFLNQKSEILQYIPIKHGKNNILKNEEINIRQSNTFIQSYQTMLIKNLLIYYTSNSTSNILIFGKSQVGKSALLQYFANTSNKDTNNFYHICSIYTYSCLKDFSKSLKDMNTAYDREKVQEMLKQKQSSKILWYKQLIRSKRVVVENIAMDIWPNTLGYFNFITSQEMLFIDGDRFQLKDVHLMIEKSTFHKILDQQLHFLQVKVLYDDGYYNEVFSGIYEVVSKSSIANVDVVYQVLKIKSVVIKNLLVLLKILCKKQRQSYKNWTYYYPLTTLKNIFLTLKHKSFKSKIEFVDELLYQAQNQFSLRLKHENDESTFLHYFNSCKQHIRDDIREDIQFKDNHIERLRQDQILCKLTTYLQYKNQFKTLKKSKTLIRNLNHFYYALTEKNVVVINQCVIPGVGNFLSVAAEILSIQATEITSLDQLRIILSEQGQKNILGKNSEQSLYKIPSWLLKNTQILAVLSQHLRNMQNASISRVGKRRVSQILGKIEPRSKFYLVIQYSKSKELLEHNLVKMDDLMKLSSFVEIQNPDESEITSQLIEYLGKQREQLQFIQNSTIASKICKIYELLKGQEMFQRMKPQIKEYIFSIDNYYRFIKNIIDTYFERKYQIKANLHQIQSLLTKVESISEQFGELKNKNIQLKNVLSDVKKRLAVLQTGLKALKQNLQDYQCNKRYLQVKERKEKFLQAEKAVSKMASRQQHLVQLIQSNKNIPRSQIAHLKSLYSNNQSYPKQILQILSLLINQGEDLATIKKTMIDINLNMRIRQINFAEQKHELQKSIHQKISMIMMQSEEYKGCQTLLHYIKYNIELYFFKIERKKGLKQWEQLKSKMQQNIQVSQYQVQIKNIELELGQINAKIEKQTQYYKQIESECKQSQNRLKIFSKFAYLELFMQECKKQKELLEKQYNFCLESSIYFSLKLNFIFASDVGVGQNQKITKNKENYECFQKFFDKIFLKWVREEDINIQLDFFQKERHKIFENKQKFYFIDKQLDNEEFDVIAKCKKIAEIKYLQQPINQNYSESLPFFIPSSIYNKCMLIKYLLNIKHYTTSILIFDRERTINKYLMLGNRQKVILKRNVINNQNRMKINKEQASFLCQELIGYLCSRSALLNTNYSLLFVEIPNQTSQIVLKQRKRQINCVQGYYLKVNSVQYMIPQIINLKIIYVLRQSLLDSQILHQFHLINMEQNISDCQQLINHEILTHNISKPQHSNSLVMSIKSLQNVVVDDYSLKKIINSNQRFKMLMQHQNHQEKYKYYVIQHSGIIKIRDKLSILKDDLLQNMTQMLQKWITLSEDYRALMSSLKAIQQYQERYLNHNSKRIIEIYEICVKIKRKLRQKKGYLLMNKNPNLDFNQVLRLIRQGLRYIELNCHLTSLQKQPQLLLKYLLSYYCNFDETKELNTYALFLKIYAIQTDQATGYQVMNLLHNPSNDNLLQQIMEYKSDNISQAVHLCLPVYKLQVQKFLKILKDLRSGKGESSIIRSKSLVLNPQHIHQLINDFQFKIVKRMNQQQQKALQQFKKFPLFTRFLLEKLQIPQLFQTDSYLHALNWKNTQFNIDLKSYYGNAITFFFCDLKVWASFLHNCSFQGITKVKLAEWYYRVEQKLKNVSNGQRVLIIDERQFQNDEKGSLQNKQKILQYLHLNRTSLMVVMSLGYEEVFYEVLQENIKEKDRMTGIHSLQISQLFQLAYSQQEKVKNAQVSSKKQNQDIMVSYDKKWDILVKNVVNTYTNPSEIVIIKNFLQKNKGLLDSRILKGNPLKIGLIIQNSLLLWYNYNNFEINFFSNHITGQQPLKLSKLYNTQIAFEVLENANAGKKSSSLQLLISYLSRKQSITQFLRDKSSSRLISSSSIPGRSNRNSIDEVEYRFALETKEKSLFKKASFNSKDFRRVSRVKNNKMRASNLMNRFSVQTNDLQDYLGMKIDTQIQCIEQEFEGLIKLCKIYEGQISFKGGYESLKQGRFNIEKQIKMKYGNILELLKGFEGLVSLKESKRLEAIYNYQNEALAENCIKNVGMLGMGYHQIFREQHQIVLRCYDCEKCEDCSALVKKKGLQKICVKLKNQLFQLVVSSYIIIKQQQIPTIRVRFENSVILAKVYCKRALFDLI